LLFRVGSKHSDTRNRPSQTPRFTAQDRNADYSLAIDNHLYLLHFTDARHARIIEPAMRRGVTSRISTLERATPVPMTAAVFVQSAETHARWSQTSFEAGVEALARAVDNGELERLTGEFEQIVFAKDIDARDAARSKALRLIERVVA
jgi:hypothetical protein